MLSEIPRRLRSLFHWVSRLRLVGIPHSLDATTTALPEKAPVQIRITRGQETLSIDPDWMDDFPFTNGDILSIVPEEEAATLPQTPDGSFHIRLANGKAIRVPSQMVLTPHREYVMPEHLVVLTGVGTDSLDWIGEMHVRNYKKYMGLWSEMTFLEIGSGIGRDAFQLLNVIGLNGRYIGVDVTRDSIAWCQKNISRSHPNFEFYHFDARHELYNPLGANTTLDFRLPAADGSVDRIAAGSVFTHLFEDEIVHYMREIARVLKPDGRAYATFFLYSESNIVASRAKSVTPFNLRFEHAFAPGCFINDAAYPTGAVAYTDEAMQHMINRAGARLVCPYVEGYWSGVNPDADDSQEVLILSTRKM